MLAFGNGIEAGVLAGALAEPVSDSKPVPEKDAGGGAGAKSSLAGGALRRSLLGSMYRAIFWRSTRHT